MTKYHPRILKQIQDSPLPDSELADFLKVPIDIVKCVRERYVSPYHIDIDLTRCKSFQTTRDGIESIFEPVSSLKSQSLVIKLKFNGWSFGQIIQSTGLTREYVRQVVEESGITFSRKMIRRRM